MLNQKKIGLTALLLTLAAGELFAGTWTNYTVGDVMVCFRKSGVANDLVVDAGSVTNLTKAVKNARIAVNQYTGTQLASIGTDAVTWSAFTYYDDTVSPGGALFISKARSQVNKKTTAYTSGSHDAQINVGVYMKALPKGAKDCRSYDPLNTVTAVLEPDSTTDLNYKTGQSYSGVIGLNFNFSDTWAVGAEKTTPADFSTAGAVVRSDFYQNNPNDTSDGSATFLGYFEFNTNGVTTYVAYPTAPTVTTVAASVVAGASAQLNCTVTTINTNTDNTSFYFQYGLTTSYGSTTVVTNIGTNSGSYGLSAASLSGGTLYHFRAAAYNQYGTNYGGDLTFTTTGGAPVVPVITAISRTNTTTYVSFTTGSSGTYTLRGTNSLTASASRTNWPAIASTPGNGSVNTLQDTTANSSKFYFISAQ